MLCKTDLIEGTKNFMVNLFSMHSCNLMMNKDGRIGIWYFHNVESICREFSMSSAPEPKLAVSEESTIGNIIRIANQKFRLYRFIILQLIIVEIYLLHIYKS
jgi:hypothetical protein